MTVFEEMIREAQSELTYVDDKDCKLSGFWELSTLDDHKFGFVLEERVIHEKPAYQVSIFAEAPNDSRATVKGKTFAEFITVTTGHEAVEVIRVPLGYMSTSFKTLCEHETDALEDIATLLEKLCSSVICDCGHKMIPHDALCCDNCTIGLPENGGKLLQPTERGLRYALKSLINTIDPDPVLAFSAFMWLRTQSGYRFQLRVVRKRDDNFACMILSHAEEVIRASAESKKRPRKSEHTVFFRRMDKDFLSKMGRKDMVPEIVRVLTRIVEL